MKLRPTSFTRSAHASFALQAARAWAVTKVGRNGIPNPAGARGGSSSSSLKALNHFEMTLRLWLERGSRLQFTAWSDAVSSSETSACRIASTSTTAPPSSWRNTGAFSTARASEIQEARIALFSAVVSFGSFVTSLGCV